MKRQVIMSYDDKSGKVELTSPDLNAWETMGLLTTLLVRLYNARVEDIEILKERKTPKGEETSND